MFIIEDRLVGVLAALAIAAGGVLLSLKDEPGRPEVAPRSAVATAEPQTPPDGPRRGPVAAPLKVVAILGSEQDLSGRRASLP